MIWALKNWKLLASLVLLAAAISWYEWQLHKAREEGAAREKALQEKAADEWNKQQEILETIRQNDVRRAENEGAKKFEVAQAAVARERRTSDSLRQTLNTINNRTQTCTDSADTGSRETVRTLTSIVGECTSKYVELAEAARDAYIRGRICQEAWPSR